MKFDPILRVAELRDIETRAAGQSLMERAGHAAAHDARDLLTGRKPRVLVIAGNGNNGGDAFVVARWLAAWFFDVEVLFRGDEATLPAAAADAFRAWTSAGGSVTPTWPDTGNVGLIVDGLFGIGLTRPIEGMAGQWITRANASGIPILALDVPSGLSADTGVAQTNTIRASATASFIALKPGLLTADGPDFCGAIRVHGLQLEALIDVAGRGRKLSWAQVKSTLPDVLRRTRGNVHKGTFGSLAIVGGNDGMVGAAILAGRAALHLGVGKVWVGLAAANAPAVDWVQPELMLQRAEHVLDNTADALVIGPGLGTDERARRILGASLRLQLPLLIDADALNLVADEKELFEAVASRSAPTVVTPHPGEAARLMQATTSEIQADRMRFASELAERLQAIVVLKGAGTIIAARDGTFAINATGSAALASGGTGDVLSGMVGALLAQHIPARDAAELAVCLHGAAADALVARHDGPVGLTASELAPMARRLINAS